MHILHTHIGAICKYTHFVWYAYVNIRDVYDKDDIEAAYINLEEIVASVHIPAKFILVPILGNGVLRHKKQK